jgi:hypothetical protein
MLRLTLEIVPEGNEKKKYDLGVLTISNIGGDDEVGFYSCTMKQPQHKATHCEITYYPRNHGAWSLVMWALAKIKFYPR